MSALVEAYTGHGIENALYSGARVLGVASRMSRDFRVDLNKSVSLNKYLTDDIVYVSQSDIHNLSSATHAISRGADAILLRNTLVSASECGAIVDGIR